jgi:hypothetical protein
MVNMRENLQNRIAHENKTKRVDVIRALIGIDGNLTMTDTEGCKDGSVILHGYKRNFQDVEPVKYFIGTDEIELLLNAKNFNEIYEIYKEIGYFQET